MRALWVWVAVGVVTGGCSGDPVAAQPSTPTAITTSTPATTCSSAQVRLSPGRDISPPTGLNPQAIRLTNRGPRCVLDGYPNVRLLDPDGHRIPFRIADSGDQVVTDRRPARVVLVAHGSAWIELDKYRCDLGDLQPVGMLAVRVEGAGRAATMRTSTNGWAYCGPGDPGSVIHTSPFEPTLAAALRVG